MIKLLQVYNQYRSLFNGEEAVVRTTGELIERHGGSAWLLMRSSREIGSSLVGKVNAFWSGIYSREAYREMRGALDEYCPDIVHVHNVYPLFSPSVLVACRDAGVPVVMSIHNQHLTCPRADHLYRGELCDRCVGGREYNCILRNCRENICESIGYALRSAFARRARLFHDNVTLFLALSQFAKNRLVSAGFGADRIVVLPNMVAVPSEPSDPAAGDYAAFAGRLSTEKGVQTLLAAAAEYPVCPIRLAGSGPLLEDLRQSASSNVELLGQQDSAEMHGFYRKARFLIVPSITYEMCPLVILEAMSHGIPVIASGLGAQSELIEDGVDGLLFEPGNARDLRNKIKQLWENTALCRKLGQAAYERIKSEHGDDSYFQRLMQIYRRAISMTGQPLCDAPESAGDEAEVAEAMAGER